MVKLSEEIGNDLNAIENNFSEHLFSGAEWGVKTV